MPDRTYFEKMETMRCSIVAIVTAEPSITLFPIVMIPSSIKLQLKLMYEPSPIYIYAFHSRNKKAVLSTHFRIYQALLFAFLSVQPGFREKIHCHNFFLR